jgi:hypothetical protein
MVDTLTQRQMVSIKLKQSELVLLVIQIRRID